MRAIHSKTLAAVSFILTLTAFAAAPAVAGKMDHMAGTQMFDKGMAPILASYLKVQKALAGDSMSGVQAAGKSIAANAAKLDAKSVKGEHAKHYEHLPMNLKKAAITLSIATTIDAAREALKQLSKPMAMWGTMSKPKDIDVMFCSMVKASWLQKHGDVNNPYYGASMLGCGEVVGGAKHDMKAMKHGGKDMKTMKHGGH